MNNRVVVIIGAGIIGLSIGWLLARNGFSVEIFEQKEAGKQTSWIAAGMLAPYTEMGFVDWELLQIGKESLNLYSHFLTELQHDTQSSLALNKCGTLYVGITHDDREWLSRIYSFKKKHLLPVEWVSGNHARDLEPLLAPQVNCGILIKEEGQIDHRFLIENLIKALRKHGGKLWEKCLFKKTLVRSGKIVGIELSNLEQIFCDVVINATGIWTKRIAWPDEQPDIEPIKGQIVTLKTDKNFNLKHMIRSPRIYLVHKTDNSLRIGATSEYAADFDGGVTAGGMLTLLQNAQELMPTIEQLEIKEALAGFRPCLKDHFPMIGNSPTISGLLHAIGHGRHGILLAPYTAYSILKLLNSG